jgi:hypothetical protein
MPIQSLCSRPKRSIPSRRGRRCCDYRCTLLCRFSSLFRLAQRLSKLSGCVTRSGGGAALHLDMGSGRCLACVHNINSCIRPALWACVLNRQTRCWLRTCSCVGGSGCGRHHPSCKQSAGCQPAQSIYNSRCRICVTHPSKAVLLSATGHVPEQACWQHPCTPGRN